MFVRREQNVCVCDFCGKDANTYNACMICGRHHCYKCGDRHTVTFNHGLYAQGTGDGSYCKECVPAALQTDLGKAYQAIADLAAECRVSSKHFEARRKVLESAVERERTRWEEANK